MDLTFFCVISAVIALSCMSVAEECVKQGPCSCSTSKTTINLNGLINKSQPNPRHVNLPLGVTNNPVWSRVSLRALNLPTGVTNNTDWSDFSRFQISQGNYKYSFEPCIALTQCAGQAGAAACQESIDVGGESHLLGKADTAQFTGSPDENNIVLKYTNGDGGRQTNIKLVCTKTGTQDIFTSEGENPPLNYTFQLSSSYVCGTAIPITPSSSSGNLSPGSVMLILFFVFLIVYFIAGFVFLRFVRGAKGLETFPNYEFWTALPGLIKDGVQFTCRGCKTDSSYSQI